MLTRQHYYMDQFHAIFYYFHKSANIQMTRLLDPAFFKRWCLILSLCVPRYLFVYLFVYERSKLFFQNATSPTFIIRFFPFYTHVIPRWSYIWLVLG